MLRTSSSSFLASSRRVIRGRQQLQLPQPKLWKGWSSSSVADHVTARRGTTSRTATTIITSRSYSNTCPVQDGQLADRCDLHIVSSPYPSIEAGPYPPVAEFVTQDWNGHLKDQMAILDGTTGLTRTFGDYYQITSRLASVFASEHFNVKEEDCIALYSPNHVDYAPLSIAVSLVGAKLTPINPMYTVNELSVILKRSHSKILITHHTGLHVALEAAQRCSHIVQHVIVMGDENGTTIDPVPEGTISLASLKQQQQQQQQQQPPSSPPPPPQELHTHHTVHPNTHRHPYLLPYSSGTTGLPKGVCLSHENLVANLLQFEEVEALSFPPDHSLLSPLPFFHIYGFLASMLYSAWKGHPLLTISGRFDLEEFCQMVEQHQPHRAHLVPPILVGLAKHPLVDNYDLSSIQMILSAAAPLGEDTERAVTERLQGLQIKQAWGMSELSPIGTLNSDFNFKSGSVGPPVSNTYAKVMDSQGQSLGPHQDGELVLKGPQVMMGYLNDPEKTQECLSQNGWLRTGDVAHYDEDGFIYITDRVKELIKVRGYQVAPAELEALLLTNDHVADVAVIQVPDEDSGELPRAYIVLNEKPPQGEKDTDNVTEEDIQNWVKERVAPYKRLEGGVVFTDVIPKSASGKILRRILRDQVAAEADRTTTQS